MISAIRRWPRSSRWSTAARIPARWSLRTMLARRSAGTSRSIMMIGTSTWPRTSSVAWCALARERQDHPVDAPGLEEPDVGGVELGLVLRVHQQHRVAGRAEHGLGARRDGRDQRVRDVADDVADRQRRPAAQALGQEVRLVLELVDGGQDPVAHLGADVRVPGQDAGDRRDRDVGERRRPRACWRACVAPRVAGHRSCHASAGPVRAPSPGRRVGPIRVPVTVAGTVAHGRSAGPRPGDASRGPARPRLTMPAARMPRCGIETGNGTARSSPVRPAGGPPTPEDATR